MKYFARLFTALDETNSNLEKIAALKTFFADAPVEESTYGCYFLLGGKTSKLLTPNELRQLLAEVSGVPLWLITESYDMVGDLAETVTLLLPEPETSEGDIQLHEIAEMLAALKKKPFEERAAYVRSCWANMVREERFLFNKLITGGFRIGVQRATVSKALAELYAIPETILNERLVEKYEPTVEAFLRLQSIDFEHGENAIQALPFYLAHPVQGEVGELGEPALWQAEWKWDGIRAQIIKRAASVSVWSRGEEDISEAFPELVAEALPLAEGTILDGEIIAFEAGAPLPFTTLQKRLNRKSASAALQKKHPVSFIAYDILRTGSGDVRKNTLTERRRLLESALIALGSSRYLLSEAVQFQSWSELAKLREESRNRKVEGLMLKHKESEYGQGRKRGFWWKWKVEPYTADMVMIYAQRGHGRRAGLYTDFTFGVWDKGALTPVAKAYSGLTDKEFDLVNKFIRNNAQEKFGPVRVVEPTMVMEIAFEGINESARHKSGVAVRFPRMKRIRNDKLAKDADTLVTLRELLVK